MSLQAIGQLERKLPSPFFLASFFRCTGRTIFTIRAQRKFQRSPIKLAIATVDTSRMMPVNPQIELLARLLDVTSLRHEVVAQNVANVNTPGYRRQDVAFEEILVQALRSGDLSRTRPTVIVDAQANARNDGNTVDIDREMGILTSNSLLYRVYAQILSVQLSQMRSAIAGR